MNPAAAVRHIVIGTAGHIDHGKTRLVQQLTGQHTHRLPEEKRRGISIDLGFARWQAEEFEFAVVDVPGHQRFVHNMVAGATGINLALLVVAADDSVMPQTREHLDIMQLLGVSLGVIAVTKTDLVEPELCELVQEDIRAAVRGTFLEAAPIVLVSSVTGTGIPTLRHALVEVARRQSSPAVSWPMFRMPIDRAFTLPGHGTIVTGSVLSGHVAPGDQLELLPDGETVRVRGVQTHHADAESSGPQQRTAVNLAGIRPEAARRGCELATSGWLRPSQRLLVELHCLPSSPVSLKNRMQLMLHLGTSDSPARLLLPGGELAAGRTCVAELRTGVPVVAMHDQRFILRRISPAETLGGGRILDPSVPPRQRLRDRQQAALQLSSPSPLTRVSYVLAQADQVPADLRATAVRSGCTPEHVSQLIRQLTDSGSLVRAGGVTAPLIHLERLSRWQSAIQRRVADEFHRSLPRRSLPLEQLQSCCQVLASPPILHTVLQRMLREKQLLPLGTNYTLAGSQIQLTKKQQALLLQLLPDIQQGGLAPPVVRELAERQQAHAADVQMLLEIAVEEGQLIQVDHDLFYHPDSLQLARQQCVDFLQSHGAATVAQLRDIWGITRRHALPLLAFFDKHHVTERHGDLRSLTSAAATN